MLEIFVLGQLVGIKSELRQQTYLKNQYSQSAFFILFIYSLIGMFVWPIKFGIAACRDKMWMGIFYFVMMGIAALAIPYIYFPVAFFVSMVIFFVQVDKAKS